MSAAKPSWLGYAKADLDSAKKLSNDADAPWHLVCYLCQQCAEKCLKAYLLNHGWRLKKIHEVVKLLEEAKQRDTSLATVDREADLLNAYTHIGRYPLLAMSNQDGRNAIAAAETISREIRSRMQGITI